MEQNKPNVTNATNTKKNEIYICKRMKLCSYLLEKGFRYIIQRPDKFNPQFNVWVFPITEGFWDCVNEYYSVLN